MDREGDALEQMLEEHREHTKASICFLATVPLIWKHLLHIEHCIGFALLVNFLLQAAQ